MEQKMNGMTETTQRDSMEENVVLMYPGNQLKEQVREYKDTFSAFKVVKETFFTKK